MMESGVEARRRRTTVGSGPLQGIRLLIVEDMKEVSDGLRRLLECAGAVAEVSSTVNEACIALTERTFDLVLLDLNLNGQNGIEVARATCSLARPPAVLVLTGDPDYLDVDELEELGTRVIMKTNLGGELVGVLRSVLDQRSTGTLPLRSRPSSPPQESIAKTRSAARVCARERDFLERLESGETLSIETVACEILLRGSNNAGNRNLVQKFVSRLRAKLEALGEQGQVIECVYGGGGYRRAEKCQNLSEVFDRSA